MNEQLAKDLHYAKETDMLYEDLKIKEQEDLLLQAANIEKKYIAKEEIKTIRVSMDDSDFGLFELTRDGVTIENILYLEYEYYED